MAIDTRYFVDVFETFVNDVKSVYDTVNGEKPYFLYGHPLDVTKQLEIKGKSITSKYKQFPLICLVFDVKESHSENLNFEYSVSPIVLILDRTDPRYSSPERTISTFKPILYPIYFELIKAIENSTYVFIPNDGVKHEMIPKYFWGKEGIKMKGSDGLIFNEYLDGIYLEFKDLKIYKKNKC